jgi:uncharacterized protein (TIGR04255 family)
MSLDLPSADERVAMRRTISTAICQIRFDEQPRVSDGSLAIEFHERLGGADGPYSKLELAEDHVLEMGPAGLQPQSGRRGWSLEAADNSWSLALLPDNVALQANTKGYAGWNDFRQRLALVLEVLLEIVSPTVEQRLGLRFVDRIGGGALGVGQAYEWKPYIAPEFLGPIVVPGIGKTVEGGQQQLLIGADGGALCRLRQGLALVTGEDRSVYVIDADFSREGVRQFDRDAILDVVGGFQEQANRLFSAAVTPALLDTLIG